MKRLEKRAEFSRRQKSSWSCSTIAPQLSCAALGRVVLGARPVLKSELSLALNDSKHYEHASDGTGDTLRCVFTIWRLLIPGKPLRSGGPGVREARPGAPGRHRQRLRSALRPPLGNSCSLGPGNSCSLEPEGLPGACELPAVLPRAGPGPRRGLGSHGRPGLARRFPLTSCVMAPPAYQHKEAASGSSAEFSPGIPKKPSCLPGCSGAGQLQPCRTPAVPCP